jgi:hypothetical protein
VTISFLRLALALVPAAAQAQVDSDWAVITKEDRAIYVETDKLEDMHKLSDRDKRQTALQADKTGWKLLK